MHNALQFENLEAELPRGNRRIAHEIGYRREQFGCFAEFEDGAAFSTFGTDKALTGANQKRHEIEVVARKSVRFVAIHVVHAPRGRTVSISLPL